MIPLALGSLLRLHMPMLPLREHSCSMHLHFLDFPKLGCADGLSPPKDIKPLPCQGRWLENVLRPPLNPVLWATLQVETLKMGWCNVGAEDGAKAVADLLMFNSTLVTLDLRGNGLGDAGGAPFSMRRRTHLPCDGHICLESMHAVSRYGSCQ